MAVHGAPIYWWVEKQGSQPTAWLLHLTCSRINKYFLRWQRWNVPWTAQPSGTDVGRTTNKSRADGSATNRIFFFLTTISSFVTIFLFLWQKKTRETVRYDKTRDVEKHWTCLGSRCPAAGWWHGIWPLSNHPCCCCFGCSVISLSPWLFRPYFLAFIIIIMFFQMIISLSFLSLVVQDF